MSHRPYGRTAVAAACLLLPGQAALVASVPGPVPGSPTHGLRVVLAGGSDGAQAAQPALVPGAAMPLDLTLTNPYAVAVDVTELGVRVDGVVPARPDACTPTDFTTLDAQVATLTVPARSTTTLSGAGVPADRWPRLGMPADAAERTGCRGLEVRLAFTATGRPR